MASRRKSQLVRQTRPPSSLVRGKIDSLNQGVSQQPPYLRQPGQGTRQVNGWSSPVTGLSKRRPSNYIGRILDSPLTDFYAETMLVQTGERYSVFVYNANGKGYLQILQDGQGCAVDVHGTGLSVITGFGGASTIEGTTSSYIYNASDLLKKYVLINNGPFGLLLNRQKVTAMKSTTSAAQVNEALLFVQAVTYDVTYTVKLNGVDLTGFTTPAATATPNTISTTAVAEDLKTKIAAVSGFQATREGSVVYVKKTDGSDFTMSVSDGRSNTLARVIKGSVPLFSDLPTVGKAGFVVRIDSNPGSVDDDYWVKFVTSDPGATYGAGSWQETVAPGVKFTLDENTMPLVVYRAAARVFFVGPADGATRSQTVSGTTYTYTFPDWGDRTSGDETTVPTPGFVGRAIKDHVLFRSRYVVIGGESVCLSETDNIFNFFNDTAAVVQETDPIDLRAVSESSVSLNWLLPVDDVLLAFSDKSQFQVRPADAEVLTPRSAICIRLSNIEMNGHLRPRIAGPNVVFATNEYDYTGFREYQFFNTETKRLGLNLGGGLNLTLNVPKLIPGMATTWDVGESIDMLCCATPSDTKRLYVYKYLWQSGQGALAKTQSAWSVWEFDGDIRWVRIYDNELLIVFTYADGTFTTVVSAEELDDEGEPDIYLDRKLLYPECNSNLQTNDNIVATYDAVTDTTTFKLPYTISSTTDAVIRYENSRNRALVIGTASSGTDIVCSIKGDWRTDKVAIGARYSFEYEFTTPYLPQRDQARSRLTGNLDGRLQIATWTVHHASTGRYDVTVKRKNRQIDSTHQFWARVLNVENNRVDTADNVLNTGTFRVPIYSRNTDFTVSVSSDSWLPLRLSGASWEGNYSDRARSLS